MLAARIPEGVYLTPSQSEFLNTFELVNWCLFSAMGEVLTALKG